MPAPVSIFWFRRDLRLHDNAGLYHALKSGYPVVPVFIFDTDILDELEDRKDRRLVFIHNTLENIQDRLKEQESTLHILHATPLAAFRKLLEAYDVKAVYTNHDYEPYAIQRDKDISAFLKEKGIAFHTYKDQVIFERGEVVKDNGQPYTIFTPYSKRWKSRLTDAYLKPYPTGSHLDQLFRQAPKQLPSLKALGFEQIRINTVAPELEKNIARHYDRTRDFPANEDGTTRLSVHLRFGTVSIRGIAARARQLNETLLNELIWRDFYQMILFHMPHIVDQSCKPAYDHIRWRNNEREFEAWCTGQTGYPLVDAGMRQLNETGWMHNRVRMIVASFLCKHLLIDWRWGEAYFGKKLIDYDLAANNGGWQWCAGSGCDAAPYFRVFNPETQMKKFDPELTYVRRWVPEYGTDDYPEPIVVHEAARDRCLKVYKAALQGHR